MQCHWGFLAFTCLILDDFTTTHNALQHCSCPCHSINPSRYFVLQPPTTAGLPHPLPLLIFESFSQTLSEALTSLDRTPELKAGRSSNGITRSTYQADESTQLKRYTLRDPAFQRKHRCIPRSVPEM